MGFSFWHFGQFLETFRKFPEMFHPFATLILAKYFFCSLLAGDAHWYRAMVLEVCGEGKARVYFVDYGNSCEVEAAHLKAITPNLLKLPFQAIRCWLTGLLSLLLSVYESFKMFFNYVFHSITTVNKYVFSRAWPMFFFGPIPILGSKKSEIDVCIF